MNGNTDKPESVLFVPYTPGGTLKAQMQAVDKDICGSRPTGRVRVVERMGNSLIQSLGNMAPWTNDSCGRTGCIPCLNKAGSCLKKNVTYRIQCQICQTIYWGETHRGWGDRAKEHLNALRTGDNKYALVKHMEKHHPEEQTHRFSFKVDRSWGTSLERQIGEALLIEETDNEVLMNGKGEWGRSHIPRVRIETDREARARVLKEIGEENAQTDKADQGSDIPNKRCRRRIDDE